MLKTPKSLWASFFLLTLISFNAFGNSPLGDDDYDDYIPENDSRVARIKVLDGSAQIKRIDNDQWERATLNLPIVEGDEIATDQNTRIELQFDKNSYLRLAENSYLKIINLQDEGIAVSLSQGTLNLFILKFDKDQEYFEIDAPQTTIAIQTDGKYRIDAGDEYKKEVRVAVSETGEARVYSNDSGFTLKNGRNAKLFLEGDYIGEWQTSRNYSNLDAFDEWTAGRDAIIEKDLRNAYYDKYYDNDIYGADDLNDYGNWTYTQDYGYIWRPHNSSIRRYNDWSPYRYGQWRWLPYYGWTWVNDEPWGWSTYHYGRWVYVNGFWAWSPYSYHRRTRSFWRPALVYIAYIGNNICWYPLPYNYGYYDYNRRYRNNWRRNHRNGRNDRDGRNGRNNNPPNNTPITPSIPAENIARGGRNSTPPLSGVVTVDASEFGRDRKGFNRPPVSVAEAVLKQKPVINNSPPLLPTYKDLDGKVSKEILIPNNRQPVIKREVKVGAGERTEGTPLDEKLRRKTIYGNRTPQILPNNNNDSKGTTVETERRGTGVFDRTQPRSTGSENDKTPRNTTPRSTFPQTTPRRSNDSDNSTKSNRTETRQSPPIYSPTPSQNTNRNERRSSPPLSTPQPRRSEPSSPPPTRSEPQRPSSPPPTRRSEPKPSSPPPQKSEPKRESKPAPPLSNSKTKSKDSK